MFAKYYQDELAWLREMGRELAIDRPEMMRYLGEPGADPDVERLLEGFAFLTGRIREKLDDEFPEVTHGLMDMYCPHYLRPIPSMAIMQVTPKPKIASAGVAVPRGTYIDSRSVDGTRCRFRTTARFHVAPVELTEVEFTQGHVSTLRLKLVPRAGHDLSELAVRPLRFHLAGDTVVTRALYAALCRYLNRVVVGPSRGGSADKVLPVEVRPAGLADNEALLPVPEGSFSGFRLLQEYFAFPERFMFVDILGLEHAGSGTLELNFEFRELPDEMPQVSDRNLLLDCVPAVNLFEHDGDPVRAEPGRSEYRLRPSGGDPQHYEIYSVDSIRGHVQGQKDVREYEPFFALSAEDRADRHFYQLRRREAVTASGTDLFVRLGGDTPAQLDDLNSVSVEFTCTNRDLPTRLAAGDISTPHPDAPLAFNYRSISSPSAPVVPPVGDEVQWRLLAQLTLDLGRFADRDSLCATLALYDFGARVDRQERRRLDRLLEAIVSVDSERVVELLDGIPVRGTEVQLTVDEMKMGGEGAACLLGTVLSELMSQYVSLNSFSRLRLSCRDHGEVFTWPSRLGCKITL